MSGLIGKKVGMTSVFDDNGHSIPVTVIEVPAAVITQIKTEEKDGYNAVQIAAFDKNENKVSKPLKGHFDKAGVEPKAKFLELRDYQPEGLVVGDEITVDAIFTVGDVIDVAGTSKGRGYAGVVARHNFAGGATATHGQRKQLRASGSIGNAADPGKVFKGKKMAGQFGGDRVKVKNLSVARVLTESNLILVTGSVPGPNGGYLELLTKPGI